MALFLTHHTPWPAPQTAYEAEALAFCRSWLAGQNTFTLHTSGSTGTPKPITLTRAQMQASARLTGQTLGLVPGDTALVCLNIRYVAGIMMLVRGLELDLPMTIIEPEANPFTHLTADTNSFAFTALVPLQLQTILSAGNESQAGHLNAMKAILVGGAATSPALEQAVQGITAPVYATYGMTETVSHIALRRLNGSTRSEWFTALNGVNLGVDERGCLHITSAATNGEQIQTNDVVDLPDPMHFRLLGRADRVINSGGVKIQPEQVEQLIQRVLAQNQASGLPRLFVAGLPDEKLGQRVVVVCEQVSLSDAQWTALQAIIRKEAGPYAVPREWLTVPQFAETPTGKVDQRAILAGIR
ncbi:AMP-binding protein [Spirosoma luteum]|uniref:AMP-binding protein n=1 Tax=Spirosoma luteum TaxID=431553 RepID=UPI000382D464|nr:AMP-binding protein [Spirosoma luteum]